MGDNKALTALTILLVFKIDNAAAPVALDLAAFQKHRFQHLPAALHARFRARKRKPLPHRNLLLRQAFHFRERNGLPIGLRKLLNERHDTACQFLFSGVIPIRILNGKRFINLFAGFFLR